MCAFELRGQGGGAPVEQGLPRLGEIQPAAVFQAPLAVQLARATGDQRVVPRPRPALHGGQGGIERGGGALVVVEGPRALRCEVVHEVGDVVRLVLGPAAQPCQHRVELGEKLDVGAVAR